MKEYLTCKYAPAYGITLQKARRFTEEERGNYAEWYQDYGFVCVSDPIKLDEISWMDIRRIINERKEDGSFQGCSNSAYIISQDEWDQLVELNEKKLLEKRKMEMQKDIEECKKIIAACERQEKLYTEEETKQKREQYNNLYNEGGEGYVPHYYTAEQYEYCKEKLIKLEKELNGILYENKI